LDRHEPERVAKTAQKLGLRYVVITSVTRDDVADGGASVFAETITHARKRIPNVIVEVLIPDFQGNRDALDTVLKAGPEVLNHNIETVPTLYPVVRPQADYNRSMDLLRYASQWDNTVTIKSGLMLGLGESYDQVRQTLGDLRNAGCQFLTLGQYLQPSKKHLPVIRYVPPEEFEQWRQGALDMGFLGVASGPFVRSSYHARNLYEKNRCWR
jgi:lipoic acid synthetase